VTVLQYGTDGVATAIAGEQASFIADDDQRPGELFRSDGGLTVYRVSDRLRVDPE
jgi:hypothetical protein